MYEIYKFVYVIKLFFESEIQFLKVINGNKM